VRYEPVRYEPVRYEMETTRRFGRRNRDIETAEEVWALVKALSRRYARHPLRPHSRSCVAAVEGASVTCGDGCVRLRH